jgi:putative spermidine/putrescine transport system ATP-binding protein
MAELVLSGLRKEFAGGVVALHDLDLTVGSGEFVSLLGPSGCGKTTALRIVAGFEQPSSGSVSVAGVDITGTPPNERDMGMVFQAYSLFPNLTARDNVGYGLRVRKQPARQRNQRAEELLELVGLADAAGRYPHQLSGGMQQRVALARALAIEPKVLLLDEPLSALDAKVRLQLREEIRRIQQRLGITTIFVTHDQEEALSISDRIAVLYQGKIEQLGPPAEIYGAPATPFVAEFVGTMNRIEGVADGAGAVRTAAGVIPLDAATSFAASRRLLVLARPESVRLSAAAAAPTAGLLTGDVVSHVFLGSVTRVLVVAEGVEIRADIPSTTAGVLPVGARVHLEIPRASTRVLDLGS